MKANPKTEMQKIAKEMAVYFNSQLTTKELIVWHLSASDALFDYSKHKNYKQDDYPYSFLASFGYSFFPKLLDAKSTADRIEFLQTGLVQLFSGELYQGLKNNLSEIGNAFFYRYTKFSNDVDEITEFLKPLSCFMVLSEMYSDYEFFQKQLREQERENELKAA